MFSIRHGVRLAVLALSFAVSVPTLSRADDHDDSVYRIGVNQTHSATNIWGYYAVEGTVYNQYQTPAPVSLYTYSPYQRLLIPDAAAAPEPPRAVQDDGRWVIDVPLRQDIHWSDGLSLTSADVVFTYETAMKLPGDWSQAQLADEVTALDDHTVRFVFAQEPGIVVVSSSLFVLPILSVDYWQPLLAGITMPAEESEELFLLDATDEPTASPFRRLSATPSTGPCGRPVITFEPNPSYFRRGVHVTNFANGAYCETNADGTLRFVLGEPGDAEVTVHYEIGPFFDEVRFTAYEDDVADVLASLGRDDECRFDAWINPLGAPPPIWEELSQLAGVELISNATNGMRYMAFNMRDNEAVSKPGKDVAFRTAVAHLIDKEEIARRLHEGVTMWGFDLLDCFAVDEEGNETPMECPSPDDADPVFPDLCLHKEFGDPIDCGPYEVEGAVVDVMYSVVPEANVFWHTDVTRVGEGLSRGERVAAAVAVLEEAGYSWQGGSAPTVGADGVVVSPSGQLLDPDGEPVAAVGNAERDGEPALELLAPPAYYDPLRAFSAVQIAEWLTEVGIPTVARPTDFNVLVSAIWPGVGETPPFDMYILGWSLGAPPPLFIEAFFSADNLAEVNDGNNAMGYVSEELEPLIEQFEACQELASCQAIAHAMQEVLAIELPYVVLFDTPIHEAYRSDRVRYPSTTLLSGVQFFSGLPDIAQPATTAPSADEIRNQAMWRANACRGLVTLATLIRTSEVESSETCANGGVLVETGLDNGEGGGTLGDGVLQDGEVDASTWLCNGAAGHQALLRASDEPAGSNCPHGGTRLDTGLDDGDGGESADDGVLGDGEVDQTAYACDGAPGADGANGTDGAPGDDGTDGADGRDGADGADGCAGAPPAVDLLWLLGALVFAVRRRSRAGA